MPVTSNIFVEGVKEQNGHSKLHVEFYNFVDYKKVKRQNIIYKIVEFYNLGDYMIKRDRYLNQLASARNNGFPKVITGVRRCGKSFLLKDGPQGDGGCGDLCGPPTPVPKRVI